jgi:hypothetical protein
MYKKANNSNYKTSFANSEMSVWKPYSVRRILNNEIYTGVLQQGKTRKINYKLNKRNLFNMKYINYDKNRYLKNDMPIFQKMFRRYWDTNNKFLRLVYKIDTIEIRI